MRRYLGLAASPGIAIGPAWVYRPAEVTVERRHVADSAAEWSRLQVALSQARAQLQALEARARETAGAHEAEIFGAHQLFLEDDELLGSLRALIVDQRLNAEAAAHEAFEHFAEALESLDEEYFRARAQDVRDVSRRVLRCLHGHDDDADDRPTRPVVVVAEDLSPSDTIKFDRANSLGICTVRGGPTSHTAILAGALGVPAVVSAPIALEDVEPGTLVVLDGAAGEVTFGPTRAEQRRRGSHRK